MKIYIINWNMELKDIGNTYKTIYKKLNMETNYILSES